MAPPFWWPEVNHDLALIQRSYCVAGFEINGRPEFDPDNQMPEHGELGLEFSCTLTETVPKLKISTNIIIMENYKSLLLVDKYYTKSLKIITMLLFPILYNSYVRIKRVRGNCPPSCFSFTVVQ